MRARTILRGALATMTFASLVACVTTPPDATASGPGPGWRKGLVVQVGASASLGPPIDSDCREPARADADAARRYVEVQYYVGRHAHSRILPIDDALRVAVGDAIYVRSVGCSAVRVVEAGR